MHGLVVNGEQIADQRTVGSREAEGSINLYTGYTENTEDALLKQFTADTGIKVNVVRLTPNRLFERISAEYGAGKLKADVVRTSDSGFASSEREGCLPALHPGDRQQPARGRRVRRRQVLPHVQPDLHLRLQQRIVEAEMRRRPGR